MRAVWVLALVAVGPVLDPIDGERAGPDERRLLPAARHLGAMADLWFPSLVNLQQSGGGIERLDPLMLSAHGLSQTQVRYRLGALDITDPARPGRPLLDLPYDAWTAVTWRSLWTEAPGFDLRVELPQVQPAEARLQAGYGGEVGGPGWLPATWFDREPAFRFGAPTERRALRQAREVSGSVGLQTARGPVRLFVEGLAHEHHYLTLKTPTGDASPDTGQRAAVLARARLTGLGLPWEVTLAWQGQGRDHEGAQYRWPRELTLRSASHAALAQVATTYSAAPGLVGHVALGVGWRRDLETPYQPGFRLVDLEDAWLWLSRPDWGGATSRVRGDVLAAVQAGEAVRAEVRASLSTTTRAPSWLGAGSFREGVTFAGAPVSETAWQAHEGAFEGLQTGRAQVTYRPSLGLGGTLEWLVALDGSAVGPQGAATLRFVTPAAGVALRVPSGGGEAFALARREPEAVTAELARFIAPAGPSGTRYAWRGTGLPDGPQGLDETGAVVGRTGPAVRRLAANLRRPVSNQVAVGYKTPRVGPLRLVVQGIGRWLLDRFTVHLADDPAATPTPFHDPGGDGLGEARLPGGGQDLTVYDQDPATLAAQRYVLGNDDETAYYLGVEAQLFSEDTDRWFVNASGAAYLSPGAAPFGNYPDRNDPGIIDEAIAEANRALNASGRYDADRSFSLKLLAGVVPWPGLSLALAARYRDGQPFSRIVVDPDLRQGPTALMAIRRGRARFTFAMTWDARLRYELTTRPVAGALLVDVYNLWGSGTELLEDVRTGPNYRRSLEVVPGRAVFVSLELRLNPC